MSDPRILNYKDFPKPGSLPAGAVRIMRPSPYGNPYVVGSFAYGRKLARGEAITVYRMWLNNKLLREPDFLEPLRGKLLVCACEPMPCHGEVILEWLDAHP